MLRAAAHEPTALIQHPGSSKAIATFAKHRHRVRMAIGDGAARSQLGSLLPWPAPSRWRVPRHVIQECLLNASCSPERWSCRRDAVWRMRHLSLLVLRQWLAAISSAAEENTLRRRLGALAALSRHLGLTGFQQFSCGSCRDHFTV